MNVDSSPDSLTRFVPGTLLDWSDEYNQDAVDPLREVHLGALMITDISGFTRLTAKLSRDGGSAGAEHISEVLNTFVTRLVALTEQQGGRVLSFEGDSIVAGWKAGSDQDLALAAWRACYCAQVLHKRAGGQKVGGEVLAIRSGVAAGATHLLHLMTQAQTRRVILTGPAFDQVLRCTALAESGEILIDDEAWDILGPHAEGTATENASVRLLTVDLPPAMASAIYQTPDEPPARQIDPERYLLPGLRSRLASSLSRWLGELRTVTVAFVRIAEPGLIEDLPRLDEVLAGLHRQIARFNGEILRIDACEGELRVLVVFGLPGSAHRDDPRRAVLAALGLQSAYRHDGMRLSIGVATGEAFCGAIGAPHRAEYTVIGEAVNRGARLSATAAGRILTDETTASAAGNFATFDGPWSIQVPGLRVPIRSFVAVRPTDKSGAREGHDLVGRETELRALDALLDAKPRPRPIVMVGEAGVGKSALVEAFMARCRAQDIRVLYGAADDIERGTPYFAFRSIIRNRLRLQEQRGVEALAAIREHLKSREELLPLVPLLRDLFDLGPAESAPVDQLPGSSRAESLRRLICDLLLDSRDAVRTVIILEDLHWADPASLALIADLVRHPGRIPILMTSREFGVCDDIMGDEEFTRLQIEPLDEQGTMELVRRSLKPADASAATRELIWDHTAGNPFFIAELCRVIDQRRPSVLGDSTALREPPQVALPQSARAAILSRTDMLPPDEQVVLKVASAAGADFSTDDVRCTDIIQSANIDVEPCIKNLLGRQLLKPATHAPERLVFGHATIRDVVYQSMLLEHRREVHAAIARSREQRGRLETESLPFVLTQWQRAGDRRKAFEYLDQVAELRLRQFDNATAISLVEEFLTIAAEDQLEVPNARRAMAHLLVGEANLNLGRVDAALQAYQQALPLLDLPLPRGPVALVADLLRQMLGLMLRRLRRSATTWIDTADVVRSIPRGDPFLRAAKAHEDLTQIYYFRSEKARLLHATLRATNLAERYPWITPVLAVNYASLGAICGVIPLRGQAKTYLGFASRVAKRVGNSATDAQVHLLTGLYETSVAEWRSAQRHFEMGLDHASRMGDWRRWSEIAVSLETITSPWFLTPIYPGEAAWVDLVESIRATGKRRDDLQVLGCGLVAALRGYTVVGNAQAVRECRDELRTLVEEHSAGIEMIHRLEAAAYLAADAFETGSGAEGKDWLERAGSYLGAINPAMKSRTLPALSAIFATAAAYEGGSDVPAVREICRKLAHVSQIKLRHFARVYPIGRPRACLCGGDLAFARGRLPKAARLWRHALKEAIRWEMPVDGCEALKRLRATGSAITGDDLTAAGVVRRILPARASEWRELMEASRVENA
ncbi:AAA family ATPase [Microvirga brassicacearum]|uniref:Guanylate cyclase domain-containing protein n=1 Tax=Microvirga brassicacearum TaxID=2580413 RepID=A0A5N3PF41_9HYPH|nr:adenylate/guanylate cyclase domain-containing protein [Microvirga brassicacearum]KAB0268346.1 hypothetical protein FEZ63_04935 [Microvirga brassicacearum]